MSKPINLGEYPTLGILWNHPEILGTAQTSFSPVSPSVFLLMRMKATIYHICWKSAVWKLVKQNVFKESMFMLWSHTGDLQGGTYDLSSDLSSCSNSHLHKYPKCSICHVAKVVVLDQLIGQGVQSMTHANWITTIVTALKPLTVIFISAEI